MCNLSRLVLVNRQGNINTKVCHRLKSSYSRCDSGVTQPCVFPCRPTAAGVLWWGHLLICLWLQIIQRFVSVVKTIAMDERSCIINENINGEGGFFIYLFFAVWLTWRKSAFLKNIKIDWEALMRLLIVRNHVKTRRYTDCHDEDVPWSMPFGMIKFKPG